MVGQRTTGRSLSTGRGATAAALAARARRRLCNNQRERAREGHQGTAKPACASWESEQGQVGRAGTHLQWTARRGGNHTHTFFLAGWSKKHLTRRCQSLWKCALGTMLLCFTMVTLAMEQQRGRVWVGCDAMCGSTDGSSACKPRGHCTKVRKPRHHSLNFVCFLQITHHQNQTHQNCIVWHQSTCTCHQSRFDMHNLTESLSSLRLSLSRLAL